MVIKYNQKFKGKLHFLQKNPHLCAKKRKIHKEL